MLTLQSHIMPWAGIRSNWRPHLEPCQSESSDPRIPVSLRRSAHSRKLWNSQNMGEYWPPSIGIFSLQMNYSPSLICKIQLQLISNAILSLFNFITVYSSYVYLLRNWHEFCEISKNNFFTEHFWATTSVNKYSWIFTSKFRENEEVSAWIKYSS